MQSDARRGEKRSGTTLSSRGQTRLLHLVRQAGTSAVTPDERTTQKARRKSHETMAIAIQPPMGKEGTTPFKLWREARPC